MGVPLVPLTIDGIKRLRNSVSIVFILISVLGFLLPLFTNVIPSIHEWAIQHTFTAMSFTAFASAGVIMGSSTPVGSVDRQTDKVREATGYVASDKEKKTLEKQRLVFQKILLVLVPAVIIGFAVAVAVLDSGGVLPESMSSEDPRYIEGIHIAMKAASYLIMMAYVIILGLIIFAVHRVAVYKRYYPDLCDFYKAESAAWKVARTRRLILIEELEAKDENGAYVKAELEDCSSASKTPSGMTVLFVVPGLISFVLPSILENVLFSRVQPSAHQLLIIIAPFELFFVVVSIISLAVFIHSVRSMESDYSRVSFPRVAQVDRASPLPRRCCRHRCALP